MRWQTMNRQKVSAMVEQKKIMDVHTESVMRRRQSLEVHHERAQVRLRQRLEKDSVINLEGRPGKETPW